VNTSNKFLLIAVISLTACIVSGFYGIAQCPLNRIQAEAIKCVEPPLYFLLSFGFIILSIILFIISMFTDKEVADE